MIMKTRFSILLCILFNLALNAQYVLVNFYPTNQPYFGMTNYPSESSNSTSSLLVSGWASNVTVATYLTLETQSSIIQQAQANASQSNYLAWYSIYSNIPAGIIDSSNRIAAVGVIYTNLLSGTNTQAQDNAQLTQMAHQLYFTYVYLNQLIAYLSRLGPGFQQIYNPSSDPISP